MRRIVLNSRSTPVRTPPVIDRRCDIQVECGDTAERKRAHRVAAVATAPRQQCRGGVVEDARWQMSPTND